MVVFKVTRVWKGDVGQEFEMPAIEETSACIGFWPSFLKVGEDLLVYASRFGGSEYKTAICGDQKLAKDADNDFKTLGPARNLRGRAKVQSEGTRCDARNFGLPPRLAVLDETRCSGVKTPLSDM